MSVQPGHVRIGVELSPAEQEHLRDVSTRLGFPQTRLLRACAQVLSDEEVVEVMRRYGEHKAREATERMRARYAVNASL